MPERTQGGGNDDLYNPTQMVQTGLGVVETLAAPHRIIHNAIGSMGSRSVDRFTAIGIVFGFPIFVTLWPPDNPAQHRAAYYAWLGLWALALVHSSASWWNTRPRHSREVGRPRFGAAEIPVSLLVAWIAALQCGAGAGIFLVASQAANVVQLALIRARYRRMAELRSDNRIEAEQFRSYVD